MPAVLTPAEVRELCRTNSFTGASTSGVCDGHTQANVVIVPSKYAADFRAFCRRNPVPCSLLGETAPGDPSFTDRLAANCDIRTDCPSYTVYRDGKLIATKKDIKEEWQSDSVAFLIGCSYSFESSLIAQGLPPRHALLNRNVPMYRTKVPLMAAGVFSGCMVVSMRPYKLKDLELVRSTTRPFVLAHGEPVAFGIEGAKALGLTDFDGSSPDFGEPTYLEEDEIAVYWGCGVTPQLALMESKLPGLTMGHEPGQMLVLDLKNEEVCA